VNCPDAPGVRQDRRPTVVFVHPSDELYGADRSLLALVRGISDIARPVIVLPQDLPYAGGLSSQLRAEGFAVVAGPLPPVRRRYLRPGAIPRWVITTVWGSLWLARLARRERAVGIVSNTTGVIVGPFVAAMLGKPHLWYIREIIVQPRWFRRLVRAIAHCSPGMVVAVSGAVATWLGPIPSRGPEILYNGVDLKGPPKPLGPRPRAVFVGRINRWKGQGVFVEMARRIHAEIPTSSFRIVGGAVPGDSAREEELRRQIRRADPAGEYLEWVGEVADARAEMQDGWVVVIPSTNPEPLGNVGLEAMAEGRAVVGSCTGGIPEMVVDGVTGLLVRPADVDALIFAVGKILSNRSIAAEYGRSGRDRAEQVFAREKATAAWRNLFRTWLGDAI